MKDVAEETGLPYNHVRQFVRYDRLVEPLKDMVDSGMKIKVAIRAQDAATIDGEINKEEAVQAAKEMETMGGTQQAKLVKMRQRNPEKGIDDVIEQTKSADKIPQITITIGTELLTGLQSYARAEETSEDDAARMFIEKGLLAEGYLEDE